MRVLVTGGKGMLGRTLCRAWKMHEVIAADLPEADITDAAGFDRLVGELRPDAVVHCAAFTAVDRCETESEAAYRVNAAGTGNVAAACRRHEVRLIAISTDYVFGGELDRPCHEFDTPIPGTVYGRSKFAGEELIRQTCPDHVIARTSWLYGAGGPSFVHTMMALADGSRPELTVVADQFGNPTGADALAGHLAILLEHPELSGTWHLTCEGEASWYEFACEIFRLAGKKQKVTPCATAEFPRPARRPANSRLDKMMLRLHHLPPMPEWRKVLAEFMQSEFSL